MCNAVRLETPIRFLDGITPTSSVQQAVPNVARLAHMVLANIYKYIQLQQQDAACGCHCLSSFDYLWLIEVGGHADTSPQTPSVVDLQPLLLVLQRVCGVLSFAIYNARPLL